MSTRPPQPASPWPRPPVSVVILTLNEEINIARCLESCAWSDDVHVLDSGSSDRTQELARSMGAHVSEHPFESFGKQRNWAIDHMALRHDWVFHLDADERFTREGVEELARVIEAGPSEAGFHVPSKLLFMGQWLKRSGGYPTYQMRFFHKARMRFTDFGHGQREQTQGSVGTLHEPYLHDAFSKGLDEWFDKHNRYSSLEAIEACKHAGAALAWGDLLSSERIARRRALKNLSYRVPFKPLARWLMLMFVQGGVLDGPAGWTYARLLMTYEQMTALKIRQIKATGRAPSPVPARRTPAPRPAEAPSTAPSGAAERNGLSAPVGSTPPAPEAVPAGGIVPDASPWTFREKVVRTLWATLGRPLFAWSPVAWNPWRAWLLRRFGARVGRGVRLHPSVRIEIPWTLDLAPGVRVDEHAILYSLGPIRVGERSVICAYAHLCAGTHDHTDRRLRLLRDPIEIGADVTIGIDAYVGPSVTVGAGCVLMARASAYRDLAPGTVCAGNPARPVPAPAPEPALSPVRA